MPVAWLQYLEVRLRVGTHFRAPQNADCSLRQGARPLKGTYKGDFLLNSSGPYGLIRAHMGPYGPIWARMGTARALEEREEFRRKLFLCNAFLSKIVIFDFRV